MSDETIDPHEGITNEEIIEALEDTPEEEKDHMAGLPDDLPTLSEQIEEEGRQWHRAGLHTNMIQIQSFGLNAHLQGVLRLLVDKGVITEEEIEIASAKQQLGAMRQIRDVHMRELRKARILEGVKQSGIIGPNGQPINPFERM